MNSNVGRIVVRAIAVLLAAAAIYRWVVLPWEANHVIYQVAVRSEKALDRGGDVAIITARENIDRLKQIAPVSRTDANFYLLFAGNARMVRNGELAVEQYSAALANADHRPEIYYERGLTYLAMGNLDAAAADLIHAAKFNPFIVETLEGELLERVTRGAGVKP